MKALRAVWMVAALALLAACATVPQGPTRVITWHKTDTPQEDCIKAGAERPLIGHIRGCALPRRDPCEIYARVPKYQGDIRAFETLGHEFMHCFEKFHR